MTGLAPVFGVLAGLVAIADTVPYVRDILRGETRPHRGTWLIWASLGIIVAISSRADGAAWSLAMIATQAVLMTLVFLLSIRRGVGGVSFVDAFLIGIAACGVVGWILADEPLVATIFVVASDAIAVAMMLPKTYRDPDSETLSTFVLASVSGAFGACAVGALDASLLLFPLYFMLANAGTAALIRARRLSLSDGREPVSRRAWGPAAP